MLLLHRRGAGGASFRGGGERPSFGFAPAASGPPAVLPLRAAGADAGRGATAARRSAAISATVDSFRFGAAVEPACRPAGGDSEGHDKVADATLRTAAAATTTAAIAAAAPGGPRRPPARR